MNRRTVGVDLANSVFQLAVADSSLKVTGTHRLTRTEFEAHVASGSAELADAKASVV